MKTQDDKQFMTRLRNILKFVEYYGWLQLLRRVGVAAFGWFFDKKSVFIMLLKPEFVSEPDPNLEIREIFKPDIGLMLKVMYLNCSGIYHRFDDDDRCFAVLDGGKIESYVWTRVGVKNLSELYFTINCKPNQLWFYNAISLKSARGKGHYKALFHYIVKTLKEEGFDDFFAYTEECNIPSVAGMKNAGYRTVAKVEVRKLLSNRKYKVTVFDRNVWQQLSETITNLPERRYVTEEIVGES